ncbi:MAG: isoprenylcysteine carboxyl methyltransferase [Burkholderiales bacterium]|nr:isoprenylcysteine carboxyl methyltransferase [Burkholderiales bacterium]
MSQELRNAAVNCALAIVFLLFAVAHAQQFLAAPRFSLVLLVGVETILVVLFLVRKDADQTLHSWQAWLTTALGTMCPLLLRPTEMAEDLLIGQIIQTLGVAFQIAALLSLNRSMGLLPAHRGIKTGGVYGIVRHPLYAAYGIVLIGYLINNWSVYNAAVIAGGMAFQMCRIHYEETLLRGYPDYVTFASKTRWRLVPYVW